MNEINPSDRYGYHIIDTDEKRKQFAPKLATDEYFNDYKWVKCAAGCSAKFHNDAPYRRPINPNSDQPEGVKKWEIVPWNAEMVEQCELTRDGVKWCGNAWNKNASGYAYTPKEACEGIPNFIAFRRPITATAPETKREKWFVVEGRGNCRPSLWSDYESALKIADGLCADEGEPLTIYECVAVARVESVPASTKVTNL